MTPFRQKNSYRLFSLLNITLINGKYDIDFVPEQFIPRFPDFSKISGNTPEHENNILTVYLQNTEVSTPAPSVCCII